MKKATQKGYNINEYLSEEKHMTKNDAKKSYVLVKDSNGKTYLCPINPTWHSASVDLDEIDDCVEEEVVGRYAGNIN
jgi:hypothetical protein